MTHDAEGRPTSGIAELIIAKNRHGQTKDVQVRFIDKFAKFTDMTPGEQEMRSDYPNSPFTQNPEGQIVTRGSRMNDMRDDSDGLDNPPF